MTRNVVLRLEEVVQRLLVVLLRALGRPVRVSAYPGTSASGWTRVRGRVLVGATPPAARAGGRPVAPSTRRAVRANLAQFLTVEVPRARVRVAVDDRAVEVVGDREGYVDAVLEDLALAPGTVLATLTPLDPPGEPVQAPVFVVDPHADLAVVSDIDDTVIDSGIAHGLVATVSTALLRDAAQRVPLEGAPELYQALARGAGAGRVRPFFYLSTSPWNLAGFLQGFLERNGFPGGPLLLTDWGPGPAGWFRIGTSAHKLTSLRELADLLPSVRFVLLGDSGQQDAEIYAAFARERPGRVAAVYIRRAGTPDDPALWRLAEAERELAELEVPFVVADDSAAMLRHATDTGLTG